MWFEAQEEDTAWKRLTRADFLSISFISQLWRVLIAIIKS